MLRIKSTRRLALAVCCIGALNAHAADPALQEEADNSKLQRQLAEDRKAIQDAKYPKPSVTPLTAGVKAEHAGTIENHILAYCAVGNITRAIAAEIGARHAALTTFVLLGPGDVNSLLQYQTILLELNHFKQQYESLKSEFADAKLDPEVEMKAIAAIPAATSVLGGIAGFLALFQSNTTITNASFTPDETAVANAMAKSLGTGKTLVSSAGLGFAIASAAQLQTSKVAELIRQVNQLKADVMDKAKAKPAAAAKSPAGQQKPKPAAEPQDPRKVRLAALNASYDALVEYILKPDAKGQIQLTSLAIAEKLAAELGKDQTATLALRIFAMGGNNMTTQSLFFGSDLYQSGGAIGVYQVFDKSGTMISFNTIPSSTGYVEFDRKSRTSAFNLTGFDKFCPAN